ncbi:MAG: glycosyltransferase family 10 [Clostridium sp.]|nr:glycosyltransferase family 10 [Clostridium sp.]
MGIIRFAYADMWDRFNPDWFRLVRMLKKKYDIVTDNENPDYVICGPFGHDYLKYDCPRIFYTGEAVAPDFNVYDYAMGFDRISFGDRYLRVPLYALETEQFEMAKHKHELPDEFYLGKERFCDFIVSNRDGMPEREAFFRKLSARKRVDSAGRYLNNMPDGKNVEHKVEFQKQYKFTIAFENSIMDGYVTEKIVQAWASGSVPIYYGGNYVENDFNSKAFIDVTKFPTMGACIEYILYLDEHVEEYLRIAKEPIFIPGREAELNYEVKIMSFFDNIFASTEEEKYRRNSKKTMWGKNYELGLVESCRGVREKIRRYVIRR